MTTRLDIEVPRNGDYLEAWQIRDNVGLPLDLSEYVLTARARRVAGQGVIIATATITPVDAAEGVVNVRWNGADFNVVEGIAEKVYVAYDMLLTYVIDGVVKRIVEGRIVLTPGAS